MIASTEKKGKTRISGKVYTRKGDRGFTYDYAGHRIPKDDIRIRCWGKIDELQAALDAAVLYARGSEKAILEQIHVKLWQTCAEIACTPSECVTDPVTEKNLVSLETFIDGLGVPPRKFVRMNSMKSILFNECRVRCRDLERSFVILLRRKIIRPVVYQYINRLSSLFFMMAYVHIKLKKG